MLTPFSKKILNWYDSHARELPWRGIADPYAVWISEIMLQQTRIETVIPYFERLMQRFPSVLELAAAPQKDILNLWEGLGYYARARNLHRAAQVIVEEHGGELPGDPKALRSLPGIGRYTAGAIASIAFGLNEPALDGNIRRVLARVFDVDRPARSMGGEKRLWELAMEHLPPGKAGNYNQALMDLGAVVCTPKSPDCSNCPVSDLCLARALGVQEQRPVKKPKSTVPHRTVAAAIIQRNGRTLIAQRPDRGLLGGMWEFPGGKTKPGETLASCLKREICEELNIDIEIGKPFGVYEHAYTHFKITLHAFCCTLPQGEPNPQEHNDLRWVTPSEMEDYPMGKIDRQIARKLLNGE
jgi:A/G-specific adenine glycosylase